LQHNDDDIILTHETAKKFAEEIKSFSAITTASGVTDVLMLGGEKLPRTIHLSSLSVRATLKPLAQATQRLVSHSVCLPLVSREHLSQKAIRPR